MTHGPDLAQIASDLESLEETIIARLIDRAQFRRNRAAYLPGESGFTGEGELSLFALRLRYQEEMDACFGRFCVPEERPFNHDLPEPKRRVTLLESCLNIADYDRVNVSGPIRASYLELVPAICREGDDAQYGSSVEHDVYAIQAISRRIHYGAMYVAESKYVGDPAGFQAAVDAGDTDRLLALLTRPEVERRILRRVVEKTDALQAPAKTNTRHIIDPAVIRRYYEGHVIPLTKTGEVRYLMNRGM
ncbi:MAG: hypothetical protein JEZ11_23990 [Desulfobacterales bacterium]|nr:hypothetical protein [Desulfobacterales bacterium]